MILSGSKAAPASISTAFFLPSARGISARMRHFKKPASESLPDALNTPFFVLPCDVLPMFTVSFVISERTSIPSTGLPSFVI